MVWLRRARAVAGLMAVATLLGLFVVETLNHGTIEPGRVRTLLALIAALLGADLVSEKLPLTVTVDTDEGEASNSTNEND